MVQVPFSILSKPTYLEEDYFVAESNYQAKKWIDQWPNWGNSSLSNISIIIGDYGSGKTHLAQIWLRKSHAIEITAKELISKDYLTKKADCYLLENFHNLINSEEEILHFINFVINNKKYLLITTEKSIADLNLKISDLYSRLSGMMLVHLKNPTSEMLEQILFKEFSDKQIKVDAKLVQYLSKRIARSYPEVKRIVEKLDILSLMTKKKLTIPLVQKELRI